MIQDATYVSNVPNVYFNYKGVHDLFTLKYCRSLVGVEVEPLLDFFTLRVS